MINALILSDGTIVAIGRSDWTSQIVQGESQVALGNIVIPDGVLTNYIVQNGELVPRPTPVSVDQYSVLTAQGTAQLAQNSFNAAMNAGCQVVSTSNSALNGTYPIDQVSQGNMGNEQIYILTTTIAGNPSFTNKTQTIAWPDINGVPHVFPSTVEFTTFAEGVAQYVNALRAALATALGGGQWVAPTQPVTIP